MFIFGTDKTMRGCFHAFNINTTNSFGARLQLPAGESWPVQGQNNNPILLTGVAFNARDKVHIVQCFENVNYAYAFGFDPLNSSIRVAFTAFLVQSDGNGFSTAWSEFNDGYKNNRISVDNNYATLYFGSVATLQGFLVGVESSTISAEHNLQGYTAMLQPVEMWT